MIEDGELARHARKARRIYHARRDYLAARLRSALPHALAFDIPRWRYGRGSSTAPTPSAGAKRQANWGYF
ncbi:hypothetical protein EB810_10135 [Altererythrobacter sp. FM1]|nr:hypothetical protein EB810_10135 [Altererythrobacter sp. FM1]